MEYRINPCCNPGKPVNIFRFSVHILVLIRIVRQGFDNIYRGKRSCGFIQNCSGPPIVLS